MRLGVQRIYLMAGALVFVILSGSLGTNGPTAREGATDNLLSETAIHSDQRAKVNALLQTYPFDESLRMADVVSEVIISKLEGEVDEPSALTIYSAEVTAKFKGEAAPGERIYILQDGNSKVAINDTPLFQAGDKFVFILKKRLVLLKTPTGYWGQRPACIKSWTITRL